jgi:MFS family permease
LRPWTKSSLPRSGQLYKTLQGALKEEAPQRFPTSYIGYSLMKSGDGVDSARNRKSYLLVVLTIIGALNYTDRYALGILSQNIKLDLGLSDTELGLMNGIAFALFYSLMGIPLARWADRGNRVTLIWFTTALWSLAVAACGFARTFWQLIVIRMVAGIGESGCIPPAHSLIADEFSRPERARAVSRYLQGMSASFVLGYFVAGWLNELYGWRATFAVIGLPGLILAALVGLTLKEPRNGLEGRKPDPIEVPRLPLVWRTLWVNHTFRHMLYSYSVLFFFSYGIGQWTPAFLLRNFDIRTGAMGGWYAAFVGGGTILGTYLGGAWAARYASRNERRQLNMMAIVICLAGVTNSFVFLRWCSPNYYAAFVWLGLSSIFGAMTSGPFFAILQVLISERMRGMSIALILFFSNLIGFGFGPWVAGALSDAFQVRYGNDALRYAMLILCPACAWGAWHFWMAARSVMQDIAKVETHVKHGPVIHDGGAPCPADVG